MQHLLLRKQSLPLLVAPGSSWLKREEKSQMEKFPAKTRHQLRSRRVLSKKASCWACSQS